jgi:cytochrome b6-f complex iron-sulfur subunit
MADNQESKTGESVAAPVKPAVATAPPAKPPVAAPAKPAAKAAGDKKSAPTPDGMRRQVIWAAVFGYLGVNLLMTLRFFFPRALYEPNTVFSIGFPGDFGLGIDQRYLMTNRVWIIREPDRIFVIFARCTHLGCTPEWKSSENKFKCPCHGSGYDSEGVNFEGPAPRPMDRAHVDMDATGKLIVDTSRLYVDDPQAGVNHFNDPDAFLSV